MIAVLFVILFSFTLYGRVFDIESGYAAGLSFKNLLLGLSIALIAVSIVSRRIPATFPISVFVPLSIGCAMAGLSIVIISAFSTVSGYSYVSALISLKSKLVDPLLMLAIGYFAVQTPRSAIILFRIFSILIVSGCILTIVDVLNIPDLGLITAREQDGRIEGFIGSAADFSTIVAATLPILVIGTKWERGSAKFMVYLSILVMVASLMLAATRAPILGIIVAWMIYVLLIERNSFVSFLRLFVLAFPVIALVSFLLYQTPYWGIIAERFTTGLTTGNVEEFSSGRSYIWARVFAQMLEQPSSFIIGMGWDVYYQSAGHRFSTHNILIDRFYSLGFLGLVAYLAAYWSALRLLFAQKSVNSEIGSSIRISAGLSLVVLLTSAMFADLPISEFYIYAFVGIALRFTSVSEIFKDKQKMPATDSLDLTSNAVPAFGKARFDRS